MGFLVRFVLLVLIFQGLELALHPVDPLGWFLTFGLGFVLYVVVIGVWVLAKFWIERAPDGRQQG